MWWSKGVVLAVAACLLGACGFRPLYGGIGDENVAEGLQNIEVLRIPDRIGQELHNQLLDMLNPRGRPANPTHTLEIRLSETTQRLSVEKTSFATRANLIVRAVFLLRNANDLEQKVFFRGDSTSIASYDVITEKFATIMAEKNARTRAVRVLAQDIRLHLAAYFHNAAESASQVTP
ncbi:MAG: hypothetical protein EXQ86_02845 [Rhodospirillales bacterium]|nr:hypothetical protein [Rhodospirillales bacterium]